MIKKSFFEICDNANLAGSYYVSLYVKVPYYGGPEEGGWWGSDTNLVAYKEYNTKEQAEAVLNKIQDYANELNLESKKSFGKKCLQECEWLESRGLDSDFLPEVDGEEEYFVVVESFAGSHKSIGTRQYE